MTFTRRKFLKLSAVAVAGMVVGAASTVYIIDESRELVVEDIQIPILNLPASLDGFTIAQLSDIHLYPFTQLDLVRRSVDIANALHSDLTVLTGDFVWRELAAIFDLAPVLGGLNAKHGVYAIIGNHDIWTDVAVVTAALERARVPVLVNQGVEISQGAGSLYLAGLDDGWSGRPDLDAALAGMSQDAPVILLLHEPDLADVYSQDPRIALHLAGHSHGGQIRINERALITPYLGSKYDIGLYDINGMWLYTNRGIGCISEPVRYNCPPEITLFTLVRA